ncbi:SDR family NAD(P)-dependent oxidoreductase [Nocardia rhamnosiphila]|uniref:SDR family NAD(P)-dependent oxidoreductase n=1 Tax=Nocardia rhamnosiphila TaxID=426716 RepID=UPI00340B3BF7
MDPHEKFAGGVAVVTGAASGIGLSLAEHAANMGMRVALADIAGYKLERITANFRARGADVVAVPADVASAASVEHLADTIHRRWGRVDLLINNAGVETTGWLWEIPLDQWSRTLGVNISGPFHGVRAFLPRMLASGRGHILNVASVGGLGVGSLQVPYIASKHAVLAMTESLHQEIGVLGVDIGISALLPGPVKTSIFESASSPEGSGPARAHLEQMRSLLNESGMAPRVVAEVAFAGMARGDLWIHTHPEISDEIIRKRFGALLGRLHHQPAAVDRLDEPPTETGTPGRPD